MNHAMIARALRPVARRMRLLRAVRAAQLGLLMGVGAALVWVAVSFAVPIEGLLLGAGATALAALCAPTLVAALWPVSPLRAARVADGQGLHERMLTALTVPGDGAMEQMQREDALSKLGALNVRAALRPRARPAELGAGGALAVVLAVLLLLPNPQQGKLDEMKDFQKQMTRLADAAEQRARPDAIPEDADSVTELRRIERALLEGVRASRNSRSALLALDEAERQLARMQRDGLGSRGTDAGSDGAGQGGDGQSDKGGNESDGQPSDNAQGDKSQDGQPSGAQGTGMQQQGAQGAGTSPSDNAQGAKSQGSQPSGAQGTGTQQQGAQGASTSSLAAGAQDLQNLLGQLRQGVSSAASSSAGTSPAAGAAGQGVQGAGKGQGGQGDGRGEGQGQGQGQGQGRGTGQGAGTGSTDKDGGAGGQMNESDGQQGQSGPQHKLGTHESIYDPTRLEGADDVQYAEGQRGEGESVQTQLGPGEGVLSGDVPYDRVIGEYAPQAAKAAESAEVPPGVRQWVRDYFDSLID